MTRQPDFTGVWIKVDRAKHHFRDLQAQYERFQEVQPYRVVTEDEPGTEDLISRIEFSEQPPLLWSAIVGDCVHNLRASLDLLVWEMVRAEGKPVTAQTGFPIFESPEDFESRYMAKVKGAPQAAVDIIKEAEPYEGAGNPLWLLHRLDIEDKHKLLVPVGVAPWGMTTTYTITDLIAADPETKGFSFDHLTPDAVGIIRPQGRIPLRDGAEVYRISVSLRSNPIAKMHMSPEFHFEVAFGEVEVVEGKPLIRTLDQAIQFVEGFIKRFPPLFRQESS
jgi:hypothetical protein